MLNQANQLNVHQVSLHFFAYRRERSSMNALWFALFFLRLHPFSRYQANIVPIFHQKVLLYPLITILPFPNQIFSQVLHSANRRYFLTLIILECRLKVATDWWVEESCCVCTSHGDWPWIAYTAAHFCITTSIFHFLQVFSRCSHRPVFWHGKDGLSWCNKGLLQHLMVFIAVPYQKLIILAEVNQKSHIFPCYTDCENTRKRD